MVGKVVSIEQIKKAKKFRETFLKTTDGNERVPSLSEFVDDLVESDERRVSKLAEYRRQETATSK